MENKFERFRSRLHEQSVMLIGLVLILGFAALFAPTLMSENSSGSSEFNRGDVMFMSMMIVHHDQAIRMAELSENRTDNENILELSENISKAQSRENEQMREWMQELGYETGNHHRMAGMATEEEMSRLENSNGTEFNQLFSELMIKHHRGGIQMAENFKGQGSHQELESMQKRMIEAQQKEIQKMQKWQQNWS